MVGLLSALILVYFWDLCVTNSPGLDGSQTEFTSLSFRQCLTNYVLPLETSCKAEPEHKDCPHELALSIFVCLFRKRSPARFKR